MRTPALLLLALATLFAAGSSVVVTAPAHAAKKRFEHKELGFEISIEDSYTRTPPKLTGDEAYIVGDWYEDAAKFDSYQLRPTFQIFWFADPKGEKPAAPAPAEGSVPTTKEEAMKMFRDQFRVKGTDEHLDQLLGYNEHLFGPAVAMKDRWAKAEKDKTTGKVPFEFVEINVPTKKKPKGGEPVARAYAFVARMTLDRPTETIEVGFFGSCSVDYVKRFQREFPAMVRSFKELKNATDSRNEGAQAELSDDPEEMRKQIKATKVIEGWKCYDTPKYVVLHHDEVDPKLARLIGERIEAIRAQLYEVLFPPDRPIKAVSVVRVCKDGAQYSQYGGPGGSAGYWYAPGKELVFYENGKKDSLSVLYHEAFHQYIYYSVGDFSPHSWFNEGHGDYFAGFDYRAGRFVPAPFDWRITEAKNAKRNPKRPPLREWINWSQAQYYGRNDANIEIGENYALGWSLVYFLRTTKKPAYQGVLDRYFNSLKGSVTSARNADEAWEKKMKDWEEKRKTDPEAPMPERDKTSDVGDEVTWMQRAVKEAFKDIDWDAIEKDWLAADY